MTKTKLIAILTCFCFFNFYTAWINFSFYWKLQPLKLSYSISDVSSSQLVGFLQKLVSSLIKPPVLLQKEEKAFDLTSATFSLPLPEKSTLKIILMWNAWSSKMEDKPLVKGQCQVKSCLFTTDMSLLHQSDIVVLHFDTLDDYPLNRQPHQRFVFFHFESPDNTASTLMNDPRIRYDYFNWTMTYRRDSDIFLRDFYGSLVTKISTNNNTRAMRYKYNKVTDIKRPIIIESNLITIIQGKKKMVTWFVGHCETPIRREEYVRQLSQYVAVDIFGSCTKKCPYSCDEMLRAEYKFYLAFENSWCPDYITEKFIRSYVYDAVPIVLGGADYSQFAPPNSYINARDFESPKELADFLILLNKSDILYAQYFDWKKDYYVSALDMYGWCDLCRMANDKNMPKKVYHDIKQWWMLEDGKCTANSSGIF